MNDLGIGLIFGMILGGLTLGIIQATTPSGFLAGGIVGVIIAKAIEK